MFEDKIRPLFAVRQEQREVERNLFKEIARKFMEKYNTDTIYFDGYNSVCPSMEYTGGDGDLSDANILSIRFCSDGEVWSISAYLFYQYTEIDNCEPTDFITFDYLDVAGFIDDQINDGQYVPDEDEEN